MQVITNMMIIISKNVKKITHTALSVSAVSCHFQWVIRPASHTKTFAGLLSLTPVLHKQPRVWWCYGPHAVEEREGVKIDTVMDQTA